MSDTNNVESLGLESMIPFAQYYRQFGVRRPVQLVAPTLVPMELLDLPRDSILHFVSTDESMYGMPADEYILRNAQGIVMVDHITELAGTEGTPRPTRLPPGGMIRDYHRKYRKTRMVSKLEMALKNPRQLLIENYALLPHLYRYMASYFRGYNKWLNIQTTMWKRVGELAKVTERRQFLMCRLPKILPTLSQLRRGEGGMSRNTLAAFTESESLFILELWKWLGDKALREKSVLSKASDEALSKMNLIWTESGKWFVMDLGLINEWRRTEENKGVVEPEQLQKRFLRLLMFLYEVRTTTQLASGEGQDPLAVKSTPLQIKVPGTDESVAKTIRLKVGLDVDGLPDQHVEETAENLAAIDEAITKDLEALEKISSSSVAVSEDEHLIGPTEEVSPVATYVPEERTLGGSVMTKVDVLADNGLLSGAEYRRFQTIASAYERLKDPYGQAGSLAEATQIKAEDLKISDKPQIPDIVTVTDKSMLKSSLFEFDSKYIDKVLKKDILRSVLGFQHAGIAITDYTVENSEDALNAYETHTVELAPVQGKTSTVRFRVPKVNDDGTFKANGVRYRLRKQRGDMPIRKLNSRSVALTSYHSKMFVNRSEKVVYNYPQWLTNQIAAIGMNPNDDRISNMMMSEVFDSTVKVPRIYSTMATRFRSFTLNGIDFFFDYEARGSFFADYAAYERPGLVVIGVDRASKMPVLVDNTNMLYSLKDANMTPIGSIESMLGLEGKGPIEMAEVKIFNKLIPVGLFLSYHMGFSRLLEVLKVRYRRVPTGERLNLSEDEFAVRFEDESFIFSRDQQLAMMVLAGFQMFEDSIRNYPAHLFDKRDIYFNILDQENIGVRYLREIDLLMDLFVDPITEEILRDMKEPTDLVGLLLRSCELLLTDWAPDETDMEYMRVKGYERIAGTVYTELVKAVRLQRARGAIANAKIELPPYAVWQSIQQDPAVKLVEESNPVHNLKEKEEITYSGTGGRSGRSMVRRTRVFHKNDMGVISEATKDSADVAITTFLTADPNLVSLRGVTKRADDTNGPTSYLSTSALLAPAADRDDPKRVNFISIQQSSGTFAKGYRATPLRTGYEQVMAHRTDDLFAYTAKGKGKITELTSKAVTIAYEDGSSKSIEIGRRFGTAAGLVFPHSLKSDLKVGDTVDVGDIVAYNEHYFETDSLNPKQALWKGGALVKTAIMECVDTLEDSSAISEATAKLLETDVTQIRDIIVDFDQTIHGLVNTGEDVDIDSILCTIEDAVTAQNNLFDDESIETLRLLSANTPRAKFKGKVEKIEVFYNGDIDDLSPSLQELAAESDRNRRRLSRELKTTYTTGRVDDSMSIEGTSLAFEKAVIRVYITGPVAAGVGDKGVFANQMKTIFGRVMSGINRTESGEDIGAIFGYQSISDRIVLSPEIMGTTNTLLKIISKRVADAYRGK